MVSNPTTRFTNTVENYIKYRPSYPFELVRWMTRKLNLQHNSTVADIGSGTGKLTELFLQNGNPTFAVEPNQAMREAAESLLSQYQNFNSHSGTAEEIDLPSNYIDFIVAGQAFHWFDIPKAVAEFKRIGKSTTYLLLIWNKRADIESDFMKDYDVFLNQYNTDLSRINLRRMGAEEFGGTFGKSHYDEKNFENYQIFDFEGLKGRYLSCSYALPESHAEYDLAMKTLEALFEKHSENGEIKMWYETVVYYGKLG